MRPRRERHKLRRVLLFGFLSGCFTSLVSVTVAAALALSGLVSLGPISETKYWVLAIFGVSSVTVIIAILAFESFCEP
jgi:hypothetical protein